MEVWKRSPALVESEAVAGEELVRNRKARVSKGNLLDEPTVRTIEERHRRKARRIAEGERAVDEVEREPRIDDVFDDEHVPSVERDVDVLEEPDGASAALVVGSELDDVERVRNRELASEIGEEDHARLEWRDQKRIEPDVVRRDLGPELCDPCRDLLSAEVDVADLSVLGAGCASVHYDARLTVTPSPLRGEAEAIALRKALDVAPVEELDVDVRVEPSQFPELAVLASDERLLHHGHLDEEILLREVEVRRERAGNASLLVPLEDERMRLVVPADAVIVEDLGALKLHPIRKAWWG